MEVFTNTLMYFPDAQTSNSQHLRQEMALKLDPSFNHGQNRVVIRM